VNLIRLMDALLRDPQSVYRSAAEGKNLGSLCGTLLLVFVITSGLYGAAMGAFRMVHPEYVFTDFELLLPGRAPVQGRVAGLDFSERAIYTGVRLLDAGEAGGPPVGDGAKIRFNLARPTDDYPVESQDEEKGYTRITLMPGADLRESAAWRMPLLVAAKTPLLFVFTLAVCALALYVLNLAFEVRLHFMPVMTTMAFGLASTGVMLGVLAPITGFFSVVTESYHFIKVLHVLAFGIAGLVGVKALYRGLVSLAAPGTRNIAPLVLVCILLYCIVGGQVAWTLKPFLGTPYLPATPPFRVESGNIYVSFAASLQNMGSADPVSADVMSRSAPVPGAFR